MTPDGHFSLIFHSKYTCSKRCGNRGAPSRLWLLFRTFLYATNLNWSINRLSRFRSSKDITTFRTALGRTDYVNHHDLPTKIAAPTMGLFGTGGRSARFSKLTWSEHTDILYCSVLPLNLLGCGHRDCNINSRHLKKHQNINPVFQSST